MGLFTILLILIVLLILVLLLGFYQTIIAIVAVIAFLLVFKWALGRVFGGNNNGQQVAQLSR